MQKFKIQIILRSSPQKTINKKQVPRKFSRKDIYMQGVLYGRSASASLPANENHYDLRDKIIKPKQCLLRPTSQKQKQSRLFTQKCLQILSKKKSISGASDHHMKMQTMMHNVVQKYRRVINENKNENSYKKHMQRTINQPQTLAGYSQLIGFQDKIQVYRLIKSTQFQKQQNSIQRQNSKHSNKKQQQWKNKPDVTGIRMNNKILKSHIHDIEGVQCFSLPITQLPLTKRHSMVMQKSALFQQQRASTSSSYRRKVSISKVSSQKFMAFSLSPDVDALYMKKLKSFLDFVFKINYSNKIYVSLLLSEDTTNIKKYKVYIGKGNNSLLIKSLLKRRFWLQIVQDPQQQGINFYWTQNKIDRIHYKQNISSRIKIIKQQNPSTKRKQPKDPQQKQTIQLNKKILPLQDSYNVQQFICKDGYYMPQQQKYICNIITNHVPRNTCIGSKKNLFKSLYYYYKDYLKTDPFQYIPKTFNVRGPQDPQFKRFLRQYQNDPQKVWIIKPGQNSNRGNGIKLSQTHRVIDLIRKKQKHENGQSKTYIIQSYIDKPFLYNNRKFDIRHYMMITSVNGAIKAYWYKQGYIRTSSQKYDIQDLNNQQMHLTNDAIQKKYQQYQKYEPGNKLSYAQFQRYLDLTYPNKGYNFQRDIVAKMRLIILDVIKANFNIIDKSRRECNFQIFGFDFMIDKQFKPWLIQINFNPCLQISCPVLTRIIPGMVQNSLRIGLDPLLPPSNHYPGNKRFTLADNFLKNLKYQLLFDQLTFDQTVPDNFDIEDSDDQQQEYADEGKQIDDLII